MEVVELLGAAHLMLLADLLDSIPLQADQAVAQQVGLPLGHKSIQTRSPVLMKAGSVVSSRSWAQQQMMKLFVPTRLILPILGLVMHTTACKARTSYACLETCKLFTLGVYSQSDSAYTDPWHKQLSHCCGFKT